MLEDRAMGDEERVMNVLFLFVFCSSCFERLCVTKWSSLSRKCQITMLYGLS